jgi:hypothetical protein
VTLDGRTHIAHHVTVDIALTADPAVPVERHLRDWCVEELLEEFDRAASELCPPDLYVLLPRLDIDLRLDALPWTGDGGGKRRKLIRDAVYEGLRRALRSSAPALTREERLRLIALEYLRHGMLPDGVTSARLDEAFRELLRDVAQDRETARRALRLLRLPSALQRWIRALGDDALILVLASATVVAPSVWWRWLERTAVVLREFHAYFRSADVPALLRRIVLLVERPFTGARDVFRVALEQLRIDAPMSEDQAEARFAEPDIVAAMLAAIDSGWTESRPALPDASVDESGPRIDKAAAFDVPPPETAFAANAGLVLLAGFLPRFLTAVQARREDGTLADAARLPMLLHCLACGGTEAGEWELLLPKILSGLEPADSCDTAITLTDLERAEMESLLQAVIGHWNRLQNVSADGLRAAFLTREGRLRREDDAWLLEVHGEAQDILLQFVPWQYSIIRLPWMRRMLTVDW